MATNTSDNPIKEYRPERAVDDGFSSKVLDILPSGVVVIDASGHISHVNQTAEDLLAKPLLGQAWIDVIQRAFSPREDDGHEISLKDGRRVNISICSLGFSPGELIVLTDLTLTRDFEQAKSRQQRLADMGEMTAHLAHQIRTPLSSAMLYCNNMTHQQLNDEKRKEYINKLKHCHQNIEQQIRDMLLFAKGGSSLLQRCEVVDFVNEIVTSSESQILRHDASLSLDYPKSSLIFQCHSESLQGALLNLIDNALIAKARNIRLSVRAEKDSQLALSVTDDGVGMDEQLIKKIMQPFFTTHAKGTGLGLAVVQAVASAHGGGVTIESIVGQGSCITIQIPWIKELV